MATVSRVETAPRADGTGRTGPVRHRITVDDYYRMADTGILRCGKRVELIDGEIIDRSPIGMVHAAVVNVLVRHFSRHGGDATFVSSQNPLRLDDENEPQPDILILRPRADCYATAHPTAADTLLVIEVADTSLAYDLEVKVPLYARFGIPEVWVIDAATGRTHVFRRPVVAETALAAYADVRLVEAGEPLPFAAIGGLDGEESNVSLGHLLPAEPR